LNIKSRSRSPNPASRNARAAMTSASGWFGVPIRPLSLPTQT
jgi:hypothetical protein